MPSAVAEKDRPAVRPRGTALSTHCLQLPCSPKSRRLSGRRVVRESFAQARVSTGLQEGGYRARRSWKLCPMTGLAATVKRKGQSPEEGQTKGDLPSARPAPPLAKPSPALLRSFWLPPKICCHGPLFARLSCHMQFGLLVPCVCHHGRTVLCPTDAGVLHVSLPTQTDRYPMRCPQIRGIRASQLQY